MKGALIVTYNPSQTQTLLLLEQLANQTDVLVVIDNSKRSPQWLQEACFNSDIELKHYSTNVGLANAHNTGLQYLNERGCEVGFIFDQDSEIDDSFVTQMVSEYKKAKQSENIAAVGPQVVCKFINEDVKPRVQKRAPITSGVDRASQIISSGMMVNLKLFSRIGSKDERLFIDGVDHEWCWRANSLGYSVGIVNSVKMIHELGDSRSRFLGFTYKVGSPIRLYYQFRNNLLLSRRGYVPLYWKCRNLSLMMIKLVSMVINHTDRKQRLKYMLLGIRDGVTGRSGKLKLKSK
ncbi:glycosyltransferase family 2 protein [Psychrosphaera haliotis]|uniref:Glycosyltransferase n=1 Tax=Psychrosphaera haliotis TaxID=555083 RepID=A0A6N8FA97_9GAMM|nr:glycosyltransferase [Psychrosphaera haliotis]